MEVVSAIAVLGGLIAVVFVLAPLFRSEEDLEPLNRTRPGTRTLDGPTEQQQERLAPVEEGVRCWNCGAVVDAEFKYCGECVTAIR